MIGANDVPLRVGDRARICLVTSAHVSSNPRLVKEADTLAEAGYRVRVVAPILNPERWILDRDLVAGKSWTVVWLDASKSGGLRSRCRWLLSACRRRALRELGRALPTERTLALAYSRYMPALARLAAREHADLYIAHNLPALPAAARAARRHGTRLGFDAEDFHRGELPDTPENRPSIRLTSAIEELYIPRCDYVTAASDGIAEAYAEALGVARPVTVLNCFPLADRHGTTPPEELARERRGCDLSLYWYSQTIGPDRGLEDALEAMARLGPGVRLHVRGNWTAGYEARLRARARELGVADRVHHLPPAPPGQLVERAARHDVGLALEVPATGNRDLCATNKIFVYLLAGLAVAATDTRGQRAVMADAPGAGFLYRPGDADGLVARLQRWTADPDQLDAAKAAARRAAEAVFCWEREAPKLLAAITTTIDGRTSSSRRKSSRCMALGERYGNFYPHSAHNSSKGPAAEAPRGAGGHPGARVKL